MKLWLAIFVTLAPAVSVAQPVLEFRNDLAFRAATINSFAEHIYHERIRKLRAEGKLDRDPALLRRTRRIVDRVRLSAEYERPAAAMLSWEVHSCRKCNENASAMAGGKLLVGEEFIAEIDPTDDELAYLLAHEMGHVIAEHTREFATSARSFVGQGFKRDYPDIQHEIDESISLQLRMAPLYQQQELEADYIGFILGARAKFDPPAMLSLLRKLRSDDRSVLDIHPGTAQRLKQAQAVLPAAQRLYNQGIPAH